ncbi:methyltransferase family protein [Paucimonas lemoignei]|uniref:Methyltransferase family protein n=1 Tax=Paucimonas lemoignei TaxID=29443 RepID=A0A4V2UIP9_PAULE|nr:class I SAM-dependent methyltransferase [Paucimonas lemoignei]TCS37050.1 methyltransferase family protein [Paucimonas lemoignei]
MNQDSYNSIATQWDAARTAFFGREREYLDTFLADLPETFLILDAGCGTGRPMAEYVISRGYKLEGIDQSSELLAVARKRFPTCAWSLAKLEDYPFTGQYGGIICWDALFHIERGYHESILQRMATSLVPGGRLMLTVGGSDHPPFIDCMFGREFFYDSFPPHTVEQMITTLGLEILLAEFMNLPTDGRDKGRYAIVAAKPSLSCSQS